MEQFRRAIGVVARAGNNISFRDLIESDRKSFQGLKMAYATKAFETEINGISLSEIEGKCPIVKSLFDGTGLLFYTDKIYEASLSGKANICSDFSISLDKNIAEDIRRFVKKKQCSKPGDLYKLLLLTLGDREKSFNYDYLSYLAEEYEHFLKPGNERPFETLVALKTLDFLEENALSSYPGTPDSKVSSEVISKHAYDTLTAFVFTDEMKHIQLRQQAMYAVLLKAMLVKWRDSSNQLFEVCQFAINTIGKFPKMEVYFAWKLLNSAEKNPNFFSPVASPSKKSLSALRGISWDLSMFRMSETMAGASRKVNGHSPDFFVPFVASYDGKFRSMVDACPLKAIIISPESGMINCIFRDEIDFQEALNEDTDLLQKLVGNGAAQRRRFQSDLNAISIKQSITDLEAEVNGLIDND